MEEKFKLGATLSYDKEREGDMIAQLNSLRSRHKLGDFISNLIRVAFENPEEIKKLGFNIESFGLTENREEFFKGVEKQVNEMGRKVDKIYDMTVKAYSLALFNKRIGVEQKSINLLQSQFVLQKQIAELCATLGISNLGHTFEANKVYNVAKNVDETLEFIIDYYDGIVNEIKQNIQNTGNNNANNNLDSQVVDDIVNNNNKESVKHSADKSEVSTPLINSVDDEIVDFGSGADLSLLSSFLND